MRWRVFGSLTFLVLAGCQSPGAGTVRPQLPPLPADLAAPCIDPGVEVGKTLVGEFARNRQALADCKRRHARTVSFYTNLRKGLQ